MPDAPPSPPTPTYACTLVGSAGQFEDLRSTLHWSRRSISEQRADQVGRARVLASLDRFMTQLGALQAVTVSEA